MFLIILFSQYLKNVEVPIPACGKGQNTKYRVKIFSLFPVSNRRCIAIVTLIDIKLLHLHLKTTKLPRPGDSEGTFRSSSQAATCLPHIVEDSNCPFPLRTGKLFYFNAFGLPRLGIEHESTVQ